MLRHHAYSAKSVAVRMLLRFFRFSILAFEVGERHVERFMTEDNSGVIGAAVSHAIWECLRS